MDTEVIQMERRSEEDQEKVRESATAGRPQPRLQRQEAEASDGGHRRQGCGRAGRTPRLQLRDHPKIAAAGVGAQCDDKRAQTNAGPCHQQRQDSGCRALLLRIRPSAKQTIQRGATQTIQMSQTTLQTAAAAEAVEKAKAEADEKAEAEAEADEKAKAKA
ncbi:hypothetical protein C0Q70_09795 [Pomacea canaliculata]|uniref:Uncharacterized protein n=1 Tax=Pomacea canaliculata TaxID=400727 RepID=A0A2T7PAT8_POMCA|nr:hypothetical protein C0Q70_09795 [Pomacea canaliculata]